MVKKWIDDKGQKSKHIFQYHIFRKKLMIITLGVLGALLLVYGIAVLYFQANWVHDFHIAANRAQLQAMRLTRIYRGMAKEQGTVLQGDEQLQEDLRVLLGSKTEREYENKRRNSTAPGASFLDFLRHSRLGGDVPLEYVTISNGENCVSISLKDSREPAIHYGVDSAELPDEREYFTVTNKLFLPDVPFASAKEMTFWFSLAQMRKGFAGITVQGMMLAENNQAMSLAGEPKENDAVYGAIRDEMQDKKDAAGTLWTGGKKIFYSSFSSADGELTVISYTPSSTFFQVKAPLLLAVFFLFFTLAGIFLLFSYSGLAQDARFVQQILDTFAALKNGDFIPTALVDKKNTRNEYQFIYFELIQTCVDLERYIEVAYRLKIKEQQAAMQVYQSQIHPHFLYNTLEIIRANALLRNERITAESIAALGSLYRDISLQKDKIALREELSLLERYLKLMQLRHPEDFVYQLDISHTYEEILTPKLWMQSLAENFFKHGYRGQDAINVFVLRERVIGGFLYLVFSDNGHPVSKEMLGRINNEMKQQPIEPAKSIGLANVYARLQGFYGQGFSMKVMHNIGGGTKVMIKLPINHGKGW